MTQQFRTGDIIIKEYQTSKGTVEVAAEVVIEGKTLHLKDIAVYPRGSERIDVGMRDMVNIARQAGQEAKSQGFEKLCITGVRYSGANPGKEVDFTMNL
jgi:hypothetical protein